MTPVEEIVATASLYQQAKDTLAIEEMILATMTGRRKVVREAVVAQLERVSALKRMVSHFGMKIDARQSEGTN